ncbi:MAG: EFR1 family ferrodoxin [Planctomycetes bacterium]|nr:EFR1 family ferrodoxin [Planctomycetota bacterium]
MRLDVVVVSFTGNTAHFAARFAAGAESAGASVETHRFRRRGEFAPALGGDALAVAFPVIAWQPPWPLVEWLETGLPEGKGRRAAILVTSNGMNDNAPWFAARPLRRKGWRVEGAAAGVYPNNWTQINFAWSMSYYDSLPKPATLAAAEESGRAFASGRPPGPPVRFVPTPLTLAALTAHRRFLHLFMPPSVRSALCDGCGLCARVCPVGRLRMEGGRPVARGECACCFSCVNRCPRDAIDMPLTRGRVRYRGLDQRGRSREARNGTDPQDNPDSRPPIKG